MSLDEKLRNLAVRRLNMLAEDGSGFLALACVFGLLLGLAMPADSSMPHPWNRIGEARNPRTVYACLVLYWTQQAPWPVQASSGRCLVWPW